MLSSLLIPLFILLFLEIFVQYLILNGWLSLFSLPYILICSVLTLTFKIFCMWLCLEIGPMKKQLRLNYFIRMDPNPIWLVSFIRRLEHTTHIQRDNQVKIDRKVVICKPRREASKENKPTDTLIWTSSLQKYDKIHFCY